MVCERKYVSDRVAPADVVSVLHAFCRPDGEYPEGDLESIYFDDHMLTSYWEKVNGDGLKRKVRVRWYHSASAADDIVDAFLEIKDRIGAARDKMRHCFKAPSSLLEGADLSSPDLVSLMYDAAAEAGFPINAGLVPAVAIRYRRHRFVCPQTGARVSVDYDIRATRANGECLPFPSPVTCPVTVCEAKSDTFRHWPFGDDLLRMGLRMESFSKYGYLVGRILNGGMT